MKRVAILGLLTALLAGCGSTPVPDIAYYRMPEVNAERVTRQGETGPLFQIPIVVDPFLADGLHSEQAILYAAKEGASVKAYHYQLWNDAPVRLVQRRLIQRLRAEHISPVIADRLPGSVAAIHVSGIVEQFERVNLGEERWVVDVALEIRADLGQEGLPAILKSYRARVPAESESIQATVRAFAQGLDQILGEFVTDLSAIEP
jgi:ABC-type uncharacterized transport system auxiliary subunit